MYGLGPGSAIVCVCVCGLGAGSVFNCMGLYGLGAGSVVNGVNLSVLWPGSGDCRKLNEPLLHGKTKCRAHT